MKKTISTVLLLMWIVVIVTTFSCKKYPEGPSISFRSKLERISNTWRVENYKQNGIDYTSLFANYYETYSKTGDYSFSWITRNGTGKWSFENNDLEIRIIGVDNQSSRNIIILRLEENSLWYYYMEGSDKHEFHMVSN